MWISKSRLPNTEYRTHKMLNFIIYYKHSIWLVMWLKLKCLHCRQTIHIFHSLSFFPFGSFRVLVLTFFLYSSYNKILSLCGYNSILLFSHTHTHHLLSFGPIGSMRPDKFSNKHRRQKRFNIWYLVIIHVFVLPAQIYVYDYMHNTKHLSIFLVLSFLYEKRQWKTIRFIFFFIFINWCIVGGIFEHCYYCLFLLSFRLSISSNFEFISTAYCCSSPRIGQQFTIFAYQTNRLIQIHKAKKETKNKTKTTTLIPGQTCRFDSICQLIGLRYVWIW